MTESEREFARPRQADSGQLPAGFWQSTRRLGLGMMVTLACCGVLTSVWRVAADENRGQALTAVKALETATDSVGRIEAIRDLVRSDVIDGPIVIPPLIHSLVDRVADVRVEVARSLGPAASSAVLTGKNRDLVQAAIIALMRSLNDDEPAVRTATVYSLASIAASKDPSGMIVPQDLVDALAEMLDDRDRAVRASTIAAIGVAGPAAAPDPPLALIAALDDESSFNRAATVRALARFPRGLDDRLIPRLFSLLDKELDGSPVCEACRDVLRQMNLRPAALKTSL
jgi:HEAT repeat protein